MKLIQLKTGDIFNIEHTPSYPKLKIDGGYVDMRDEIVNKSGNCDERKVYVMEYSNIANALGDEENLQEWIEEKKEKYLNPLKAM